MPFNTELQSIYEECYKPIIEANHLTPIVLTETRNGSPIYSQIIADIQTSYLIIADLSIARPNCYFEVGYTIGQGKHDNLIMCCREDHSLESPNHPRQNNKEIIFFNLIKNFLPAIIKEKFSFYFTPYLEQHKIHFDLTGYNIIFWSHEKKDDFKFALDKEIKQRLKLLAHQDQNIGVIATTPPSIKPSNKMSSTDIQNKFKSMEQLQEKELKNVKN